MLTKIRKKMSGEGGFTLIELLVVIIIIGILAAIAIPTYLGQRQRAQDASAKSAVRSAMTAMETAYVDTRDLSGVVATVLQAIEPTYTFSLESTAAAAYNPTNGVQDGKHVYFFVTSTNKDYYAMGARSQSTKTFGVEVNKAAGTITYYINGTSATW